MTPNLIIWFQYNCYAHSTATWFNHNQFKQFGSSVYIYNRIITVENRYQMRQFRFIVMLENDFFRSVKLYTSRIMFNVCVANKISQLASYNLHTINHKSHIILRYLEGQRDPKGWGEDRGGRKQWHPVCAYFENDIYYFQLQN